MICVSPAASVKVAGSTPAPVAPNVNVPGEPGGIVILVTEMLPRTSTGMVTSLVVLHLDVVPGFSHAAGGDWQEVAVPAVWLQVTSPGIDRRPVWSGMHGTVIVPTWTTALPPLKRSPQMLPSALFSGGGEVGT